MIVYAHKNPVTFNPFYIGIGTMRRSTNFRQRGKAWDEYVKLNGKPVVEVLHENVDQQTAYQIEIYLIRYYGKKVDGIGDLVNITDGGKTFLTGFKKTPEQIERMRQISLNMTPEHRQKMSIAQTGKKQSEETKKKRNDARKGIIPYEGFIEKLQEGRRLKPLTEEGRKRLSDAHKGYLPTDEQRRKLSISVKESWIKRKQNKLNIKNNNYE